MRVGDLVRVWDRWWFVYPEYRGVVGIVVNIKECPIRTNRIRFLHPMIRGQEYTVMDDKFLEVINEDR